MEQSRGEFNLEMQTCKENYKSEGGRVALPFPKRQATYVPAKGKEIVPSRKLDRIERRCLRVGDWWRIVRVIEGGDAEGEEGEEGGEDEVRTSGEALALIQNGNIEIPR